jgi:hypothetical protein
MNRSKGRGKLGLGLSAFAELSSAPPTPTAIRSPRKRADMRMRQRTSTLSSESSDLDTVGDGLAPATPDGSAARDRRPSLTAPAAAQDLEASVLSFMAAITTDPYSLSEAASTDTLDFFSEGADKREQEEEEEEVELVEVEAGVRDKDEKVEIFLADIPEPPAERRDMWKDIDDELLPLLSKNKVSDTNHHSTLLAALN